MTDVERVSGLTRDEFWKRYVLPARPVIITDLLAGAPIAAVRDRAEALAKLGKMPLTVRGEYSRSLLMMLSAGPSADWPAETMSLGAYYRHVDSEPDTSRMSMEERTPAELAALAPVPSLCTDHQGGDDGELVSTLFVGNARNFAPLHYDGDARHVLLYQVFGYKRITILPACHGELLAPIANFSTLRFALCDNAARAELLTVLGGWECVLQPGEAVFMPALVYHAADYLDDGMSVNFRFGRNRYHKLLTAHVHMDPWSQRLLAASITEPSVETEHRDRYRRLAEALVEPAATSFLKYREIRDLLKAQCGDLSDKPARANALESIELPFAELPEVVREALLRAHLFKDQLYRHRQSLSLDDLAAPLPQ